MKSFLELDASKALTRCAKTITIKKINRQFDFCTNTFQCKAAGINLDYRYQHVTEEILDLLVSLVQERELSQAIHALMSGEKINKGRNIPALHTALRSFQDKPLIVDGQDIMAEIFHSREKMREVVREIRSGEWVGYSNKKIQHIVNIGIGGSDLGQRFCLQALKSYITDELEFHFISDADPNSFKNTVTHLNPETTLFIIASKSFTTVETLYNAKKAKLWIGSQKYVQRHFIAVTADKEKAKDFGINHIIKTGEWVGGRYSLCSAINLITAIAIGFDHFSLLLQGANTMDQHFQTSPENKNLPVLLALLGIWNNNFLHIHNLLLLTYLQQLEQFVPYIQQLDMESNGKFKDRQGRSVNYATGPIVLGGLGSRAQHSYYQLLCQGTHKIAADMISVDTFDKDLINRMCMKKIQTLTQGVPSPDDPGGYIPGGTPLNHIRLADCTPEIIGSLSALYEHKIYVQSVLWDINPFDQPGVDSTKYQAEYA